MTKKAFITGGSRGIGRGIVYRLAKAGYDIAFTYHTQKDDAVTVQKNVLKLGQRCFYYQANLEERNIPSNVTKKAINDLGGLDLLVCNAGKTKFTSIRSLDTETMDFLYRLDYRSYLLTASTAIKHMIQTNTVGTIIFITSTRGIRAYRNDVIYGSLKAALNRAVQSIAIEVAEYGITINAIAPGATATRGNYSENELKDTYMSTLVPMNRKGKPDDIASLVEYLAHDETTYITGETIKVDGGLILYGPNESENGGMY